MTFLTGLEFKKCVKHTDLWLENFVNARFLEGNQESSKSVTVECNSRVDLGFFELIFSSFYRYVVFGKKFLVEFSIPNSSFRFF